MHYEIWIYIWEKKLHYERDRICGYVGLLSLFRENTAYGGYIRRGLFPAERPFDRTYTETQLCMAGAWGGGEQCVYRTSDPAYAAFAGGSYEDHKPEMDFKYFVLRGGLSGTDLSYRASEDRLYDSAYFSDVTWRDQLFRVAVPPEWVYLRRFKSDLHRAQRGVWVSLFAGYKSCDGSHFINRVCGGDPADQSFV